METNSESQQSSRNPLPQRAVLAVALVAIVLAAGAFGALIASGGDSDDADPITLSGPAASTPTAKQTPAAAQASPTEHVDADDVPIPAAEIKAIEAAALKFADGGSVTEIDRSDDVGEAFEVEVMTNAGEVDVALDDNLERVTNLRYDDDR